MDINFTVQYYLYLSCHPTVSTYHCFDMPMFRHIHNIVEIPGCRNIGTQFKSQYFDKYNIMSEYWVVETAARIINPSISTTYGNVGILGCRNCGPNYKSRYFDKILIINITKAISSHFLSPERWEGPIWAEFTTKMHRKIMHFKFSNSSK